MDRISIGKEETEWVKCIGLEKQKKKKEKEKI